MSESNQYYTFNGLTLFRTVEKAAQYAIDSDLKPDEAVAKCMLLDGGHLYPMDRHDQKDFEMYYRGYQTLF